MNQKKARKIRQEIRRSLIDSNKKDYLLQLELENKTLKTKLKEVMGQETEILESTESDLEIPEGLNVEGSSL